MMLNGPCVIEEPESTIVVPPGCLARIDRYLNVVISLGSDARSDTDDSPGSSS
jgi:hypothetical protein